MTEWLAVALLGALVGLDTTSFAQIMISRPVVAGALAGAVFGRPVEGVMLGFLLEAFALVTLPIGASRYPESGTAAVAATAALMGTVAGPDPGVLVLALAFALGWERLAGETVVLLRRVNGRLLPRGSAVAPAALERRHLLAMALDFVRAGVVTVLGAFVGLVLLRALAGHWALPAEATWGALTVLVAAMVGAMLPLFGGARVRRMAWVVGLAAGVAAGVTL